jgi:CheY-like chemotaxis protein
LPCVLIIDDEPDGCEVVAAYLAKAGHVVRCVASGGAALVAMGEQVPDAILLDVRMPSMDGLELLAVMRRYRRWYAVPIALLTAYPEDPRLWNVAEYGVTKVFTKSAVNLDELLAWVEAAAGGGAARPDARPTGSDDACRHADTE